MKENWFAYSGHFLKKNVIAWLLEAGIYAEWLHSGQYGSVCCRTENVHSDRYAYFFKKVSSELC